MGVVGSLAAPSSLGRKEVWAVWKRLSVSNH
jgi:hypothetical protein